MEFYPLIRSPNPFIFQRRQRIMSAILEKTLLFLRGTFQNQQLDFTGLPDNFFHFFKRKHQNVSHGPGISLPVTRSAAI
jgi:hypothetical protein